MKNTTPPSNAAYTHRDYPGVIPTDLTLYEWICQWTVRKANGIDGTSAHQIQVRMRRILELLGEIPLQALTMDMIQEAITLLQADNYSASSAKCAFTFFSHSLDDAVKRHYLAYNPCIGIQLPKYRPKHCYGLSDSEYSRFLSECERSPYGLFFRTMIAAALRFGENQALTWKQVRFDQKMLLINQQITWRDTSDGMQYILLPYTKYRKQDTIRPTKDIFPLLLAEKERQQALSSKNNIPWDENTFIYAEITH